MKAAVAGCAPTAARMLSGRGADASASGGALRHVFRVNVTREEKGDGLWKQKKTKNCSPR